MMKKNYFKLIFTSVWKSKSRFLAIFAIVALGVGFLAGLISTTPDMRLSVDSYFDERYFHDIKIQGTLGLTDSDIDALYEIDGVTGVMGTYMTDALISYSEGIVNTARIESVPVWLTGSASGEYQNRLTLIEGRYPNASNELVAVQVKMSENAKVGDVIYLTEPDKTEGLLSETEYVVVGIVNSPMNFSIDTYSTTLGSGTVERFFYGANNAFCSDFYANIYISVYSSIKYNAFSEEYENAIKPIKEKIEEIASGRCELRFDEVKITSQKELNKAKLELQNAEKELDDARSELLDGRAELNEAEKELNDGLKQYEDGLEKIEKGKDEYLNGLAEFNEKKEAAEEQIDDAKLELAKGQAQLQLTNELLGYITPVIDETAAFVENDVFENIDEYIAWLRENGFGSFADEVEKGSYATVKEYYEDLKGRYDGLVSQLEEAKAALELAETALKLAEASGKLQLKEAERELNKAQEELIEGEKALAETKVTLDFAKQELEEGRQELLAGQTEFDESIVDAEKQIEDAKKQIADGEEALSAIKKPTWYVFDRQDNAGFSGFGGNADKIEAIAKVFPVFFFLVAALVALTTMTRMVEEERTQIGTLKALGYSGGQIILKYMLYAGLSSVLASVVGILIGMKLFPTVIWGAYSIMYLLPPLQTPINLFYAVITASAAILCTMLATLGACLSTLREQPSRLMLPRAPKTGKRVFLERIGIIWNRLSFIHKVTARNIIRYKKRFFMTVIGISGCTALLVTGFGLNDSICNIANLQFDEICTYDAVLGLQNDDCREELDKMLNEYDIEGYIYANQETVTIPGTANLATTYLEVPEEFSRLYDFVTFRNRETGEQIEAMTDKVIITEKLAEKVGIEAGGEITIRNSENAEVTVPVGGVAENYVYNYIYMPPELYEKCFGAPEYYNMVLFETNFENDTARAEKYDQLLNVESVVMLHDFNDTKESLDHTFDSIGYIVWVLVFSAGALAIVVLYNLININIAERQKEIATLKVLGFYDRETAAYIYRETAILCLIGTALGLILGIFLHAYVISMAEVDMVMFGREIAPLSYVYSAVLTVVFSVIVCLIMLPKIKKIDMVESLKAGE